ncbi:MAG: hypothetical protein IKO51_09240 [Clostridia bacterium]|nr:hypothetical protein [Clostridia bacterium]
MNDNRNTDHPILLTHEDFEDANAPMHFIVKASGTVYTVNAHFDPDGKQSVFDLLKKLLLTD